MSKLTIADRVAAYEHAKLMIEQSVCFGVCNCLLDWIEKKKPHIGYSISQFPEFLAQRPPDSDKYMFWWSILDTESRIEALNNAIQLTLNPVK